MKYNKNRKPSLEDDGEVSSIPTDKSSGEEQHAERAADGRHKGFFLLFFFYLFVPPSSSRSSTQQHTHRKERRDASLIVISHGQRAAEPITTFPIQNNT